MAFAQLHEKDTGSSIPGQSITMGELDSGSTSPSAGDELQIDALYKFSISDAKKKSLSQSALLARREDLTNSLIEDSYSIHLYQTRCGVYDALGYPDLAAGDAYKALLLVDEVTDETGEYHDQALESLSAYIATLPISTRLRQVSSDEVLRSSFEGADSTDASVTEPEALFWAHSIYGAAAPIALAHHLASIGCLRTAYEYASKASSSYPASTLAKTEINRIRTLAVAHFASQDTPFDQTSFNPQDLPDVGSVRREVYPWNEHEADRNASAALALLNAEMSKAAPGLAVRITELPNLGPTGGAGQTVKQLGVFALRDIAPGEEVLRERSLLTATSSLHAELCDACGSDLPRLDAKGEEGPVSCPNCADAVFCSDVCLELAQGSYHAAICGVDDIDTIAKVDISAADAPTAMYTLLVLRAFAMSLTQDVHPLELSEVRYIWGDFVDPGPSPLPSNVTDQAEDEDEDEAAAAASRPPRTLPFTFSSHILTPLHFLTLLDMNIFAPASHPSDPAHALCELWVVNTLFAKLRATASARMDPRTGRPETAAVHPLWCLANHSCDPNVGWEWAGEVRFVSRKERVGWGGGGKEEEGGEGAVMIRKGEEVLNHYVDVELPVKERREWGMGALGGMCMCERCVWEAAQEHEDGS